MGQIYVNFRGPRGASGITQTISDYSVGILQAGTQTDFLNAIGVIPAQQAANKANVGLDNATFANLGSAVSLADADQFAIQRSGGTLTKLAASAAKTYFQAGLAAIDLSNATFAAPSGAPRSALDKIGDIVSLADYGAVGDGVTDDSAAIIAAVTRCVENGSYKVYCDGLEYAHGPLILGNGSTTQYSTVNQVQFIGVGAPFQRLYNSGSPLTATGTRFKYIGAIGGTQLTLAGPADGFAFTDIAFNGNGRAARLVDGYSQGRPCFESCTFDGATGTLVRLTTVAAEVVDGQSEALGTEGAIFDNCRWTGQQGVTCLDLDGFPGSAADGFDTVRCYFNNSYMLVHHTGGVGLRCAYTDQNSFPGLYMTGYGASDGTGVCVELVGTATVPNGYHFPQNIRLTANSDIGQLLPVKVTGTPGGGHRIDGLTLFDQQYVPRAPENRYIAFTAVEAGDFPHGGWWGEGGPVLERSLRNQLRNSTFERAVRGASFTAVVSGAYTIDDFLLVYDGAAVINITRQSFPLGQTAVVGEPRHWLDIQIVSATGGSYMLFGQRIPDVNRFEGRYVTLAADIKTTGAARTINGTVQQYFGTGGSPSSVAATSLDVAAAGTSWKRLAQGGLLQANAGKTRGTNGDDYLAVYWSLPVNTPETYSIACPQFEAGRIDTAFERRLKSVDDAEGSRFLQVHGMGVSGFCGSSSLFQANLTTRGAMRATPSVSLLTGVTPTIDISGDGIYTAGSPTISMIAADPRGAVLALDGFSGMTTFRPGGLTTSPILLSAEL